MKTAISAGGLAFRVKNKEIQVLLVRPFGKSKFEVPKGHMNKGETLRDTAKREIEEETGIKCNLFEQLPPYFTKNKYEMKGVVIYIAKPTTYNQFICGDGENAEISWFNITDMPDLNSKQENLIWKGIYRILHRVAGTCE